MNKVQHCSTKCGGELAHANPFIEKTPYATILGHEINGKFNPSLTLLPDASTVPNRFIKVFYESLRG